jgi:hypothetical protein
MATKTEKFVNTTIDAITGKVTERDMTADELAQRDAGQAAWLASESQSEARAEARISALAKLAKLGLSAEEVAAL